MAKSKNPRKSIKETQRRSRKGNNQRNPPPSWEVMKNILTCKHLQVEQNPKQQKHEKQKQDEEKSKSKKMRSTMVEPAASSPEPHFSRRKSSTCSSTSPPSSSSSSSVNNSGGGAMVVSSSSSSGNPQNAPGCGPPSKGAKGMGLRRLSGCYECRMVVDPVLGFTRDPSLRATIRSCPQCGDIFMKPELLELHQATRHAVSELGAEDTSKKIVEIIFQSSWVRKKQGGGGVCNIERILKVENRERRVNRFEEYRKWIKGKEGAEARCIADGNELLRFHCTSVMCSLGLNSSSNLCSNSLPRCDVCTIIRDGFKAGRPILTTASSGHAHDQHHPHQDTPRRAMLVCRVIAGRVNMEPAATPSDQYDSAAGGGGGLYSTLDELYVYNPKAILPCFVVIYTGFN